MLKASGVALALLAAAALALLWYLTRASEPRKSPPPRQLSEPSPSTEAAAAKQSIRDSTAAGFLKMKRTSAAICGITRDNGATLPNTLALIDRLGACFGSYRVVLYENDSSDDTRDVIRAWQRGQEARVTFLSETLGAPPAMAHGGLSRGRFERLAHCRNRLLGELRRAAYAGCEYVLMLDMDVWDCPVEGVANSFGQHAQWDMVAANGMFGRTTYYDGLAYRDAQLRDTLHSDAQRGAAQRALPELQTELVPVHSAFGALAIYRRRCLLRCDYTGEDCEHVGLHACMRRDPQRGGCARLFVNPQMKLYYPF